VGLAFLIAGVGLWGWALATLGQYFTIIVQASPDQPVIATGPYGRVRQPGYAGALLASIGIGLMSGNWVGLAAMTLLPLFARKRLVPLIW
jgi:protein-S-isoprenylcysteine O-methyltransferase Ste14